LNENTANLEAYDEIFVASSVPKNRSRASSNNNIQQKGEMSESDED
jgi:hypothetical protein